MYTLFIFSFFSLPKKHPFMKKKRYS